ncbi:Hypothetical predicted protein [Octopus vulgaris]|uniref:Uncharacterized protein n=1 Tax=Octopus vulgaris TaxID=6645 RepID=A0AA36EXL9_OCTVU|nr:Hypothetical predicted protein [Octopus vulgaris]
MMPYSGLACVYSIVSENETNMVNEECDNIQTKYKVSKLLYVIREEVLYCVHCILGDRRSANICKFDLFSRSIGDIKEK